MPHQVMTSAQSVTSHLPLGLLFKPADISGEPKIVYSNFHELKADDIDGKEVNFADLNGKVQNSESGHHCCVLPIV